MGDAADDAFDAAMKEQEQHAEIINALQSSGCSCPTETIVELNEDGLWECQGCHLCVDL